MQSATRQFKFRVWDTFLRKYVKIFNYYVDENGALDNIGGQYVIQEATCILDNNKKQIYEGDIVLIYTWDSKQVPYLIKWQYGSLNIHGLTEFGPATIIGNMHENPELLNSLS